MRRLMKQSSTAAKINPRPIPRIKTYAENAQILGAKHKSRLTILRRSFNRLPFHRFFRNSS